MDFWHEDNNLDIGDTKYEFVLRQLRKPLQNAPSSPRNANGRGQSIAQNRKPSQPKSKGPAGNSSSSSGSEDILAGGRTGSGRGKRKPPAKEKASMARRKNGRWSEDEEDMLIQGCVALL
jgi:hypothetical protein